MVPNVGLYLDCSAINDHILCFLCSHVTVGQVGKYQDSRTGNPDLDLFRLFFDTSLTGDQVREIIYVFISQFS